MQISRLDRAPEFIEGLTNEAVKNKVDELLTDPGVTSFKVIPNWTGPNRHERRKAAVLPRKSRSPKRQG